jgi:UDP-GlcNAc:undecaprenyl-phosphate GlcNAc-1-phosphate transferase
MRPDLHSVDQNSLVLMALILAMVCLAFWFHDFYPAKILMGDTGSMFLGYILAALAMFSGGKIATAFLVLGCPILDAFWVILRRVFAGKSPFHGDLQHFHHRLVYAGLTTREALLVLYLFSALFGFWAIWLGTQAKIWAIVILLSTMAIVGFGVVLMEIEKKRKNV